MKLLGRLRGDLETERLLLRRWKQADFQDFLRFASDPEVMPKAGAKPVSTMEEARSAFQRAMRDEGCFAIVLKEEGTPIGQIKFQKDFRRPSINSLSIGYELCREHWGKGYMTEALGAMVTCAFEKRRVDVLAISHFSVNHRSRRVIEKCGFRREGVLPRAFMRYDGQVFDDVCYSILREEYFGEGERRNALLEKPGRLENL